MEKKTLMKSPARDRVASTASIKTYVTPDNDNRPLESELNDAVVEKLLTQISTLYSSKNPKVQKTIIAKEYARDPEFEDNLVRVNGKKSFRSVNILLKVEKTYILNLELFQSSFIHMNIKRAALKSQHRIKLNLITFRSSQFQNELDRSL